MATPKQVRFHYARLRKLTSALSLALNEAHDANVIRYDKDKFQEDSPCKTHWQTQERIRLTTEKALAQAMREEIERAE